MSAGWSEAGCLPSLPLSAAAARGGRMRPRYTSQAAVAALCWDTSQIGGTAAGAVACDPSPGFQPAAPPADAAQPHALRSRAAPCAAQLRACPPQRTPQPPPPPPPPLRLLRRLSPMTEASNHDRRRRRCRRHRRRHRHRLRPRDAQQRRQRGRARRAAAPRGPRPPRAGPWPPPHAPPRQAR